MKTWVRTRTWSGKYIWHEQWFTRTNRATDFCVIVDLLSGARTTVDTDGGKGQANESASPPDAGTTNVRPRMITVLYQNTTTSLVPDCNIA